MIHLTQKINENIMVITFDLKKTNYLQMKNILILLTTLLLGNMSIAQNDYITLPSGLKYKITQKAEGAKPTAGEKVKVHYTGKLTNDTIFDSSVKRGVPFEFTLGRGQVIKGWDEGIALLHVGEKATFIIPPALGYGDRDMGTIPSNATLIFDVELIGIAPKPAAYDTKGKETKTLTSGVKYTIIQQGPGPKAGPNMTATFHYTGWLEDGTIFDSSIDKNRPGTAALGENKLIPGLDEGIQQMTVGSKAQIFVPAKLGFGDRQAGSIAPNSNLIFDIELIKVVENKQVEPYKVAGKDTNTTKSGLKYIVVNEGKGAKPEKSKKVNVHYTGFFEDGKIFDSSVQREQPFSFELGNGNVISGWDEGVALMSVGAKYRFIIPYQLAYGEQGMGPIPPKATLIFDVELISFN